MKFLSQEQKETISKSYGITVESINKRIELWSIINDPDVSKPDLVEAQKEWIRIQQDHYLNCQPAFLLAQKIFQLILALLLERWL